MQRGGAYQADHNYELFTAPKGGGVGVWRGATLVNGVVYCVAAARRFRCINPGVRARAPVSPRSDGRPVIITE